MSQSKRLKSVISLRILSFIAFKNLMSKKLRTSLTISGIIIGVGAVVFLVSLAFGLHQVVNKQVIGSKSVNSIDVTTPNSTTLPLDNSKLLKIGQFQHAKIATPTYILAGKITYQNSQSNTVVYGTNNQYLSLSGLKYVTGSHKLTTTNSAIVNTSLLSLIGQNSPSKAINENLDLSTQIIKQNGAQKVITSQLKIAGVVNTGSGAEVYTSGQPFFGAGQYQYGQIKVLADNRSNVNGLRQQIEGLGLTTASPLDTLSQINTIFDIFTYVVIGFGGIGMIIAILGMFNTLTISLLERTSEIGLMITMGARKADVKRLLIFEALLLSVSGGVGGIFCAWLLGEIINIFLTHFANARGVSGFISAFEITISLVLLTIIMTVAVGVAVSFYPSRRASKINPIDALRHQ